MFWWVTFIIFIITIINNDTIYQRPNHFWLTTQPSMVRFITCLFFKTPPCINIDIFQDLGFYGLRVNSPIFFNMPTIILKSSVLRFIEKKISPTRSRAGISTHKISPVRPGFAWTLKDPVLTVYAFNAGHFAEESSDERENRQEMFSLHVDGTAK